MFPRPRSRVPSRGATRRGAVAHGGRLAVSRALHARARRGRGGSGRDVAVPPVVVLPHAVALAPRHGVQLRPRRGRSFARREPSARLLVCRRGAGRRRILRVRVAALLDTLARPGAAAGLPALRRRRAARLGRGSGRRTGHPDPDERGRRRRTRCTRWRRCRSCSSGEAVLESGGRGGRSRARGDRPRPRAQPGAAGTVGLRTRSGLALRAARILDAPARDGSTAATRRPFRRSSPSRPCASRRGSTGSTGARRFRGSRSPRGDPRSSRVRRRRVPPVSRRRRSRRWRRVERRGCLALPGPGFVGARRRRLRRPALPAPQLHRPRPRRLQHPDGEVRPLRVGGGRAAGLDARDLRAGARSAEPERRLDVPREDPAVARSRFRSRIRVFPGPPLGRGGDRDDAPARRASGVSRSARGSARRRTCSPASRSPRASIRTFSRA